MPCQTCQGRANHRYYVHTYTPTLPLSTYLSPPPCVMCIWKFGAVSKFCSEGIHKFSYQNYNNVWGNDERGALRTTSLDVVSPLPFSHRLWKCRKPARGLESWLVSDFQSTQDWRLKSNLIKCIAGILQK